MENFVIVTDSCADLEQQLRDKYQIEYIPMGFTINDKNYPALPTRSTKLPSPSVLPNILTRAKTFCT